MEKFSFTVVFLMALVASGNGFCTPPFGWHMKSLVQRIEMDETNFVVRAEVLRTHPSYPYKMPYTADLEIKCTYKDTSNLPPLETRELREVPGFGGTWDCAETRVYAGTEFFLLLSRDENGVKVAEVNGQSAAEPVIPSRLNKVEKDYHCIDY